MVGHPFAGMGSQMARMASSRRQTQITGASDYDIEGLLTVVDDGTSTGQVGMEHGNKRQVVLVWEAVVRVEGKDETEISTEDSTLFPDGQDSMWDFERDSRVSMYSADPCIVDHTRDVVTVVTEDESVPIALEDDSSRFHCEDSHLVWRMERDDMSLPVPMEVEPEGITVVHEIRKSGTKTSRVKGRIVQWGIDAHCLCQGDWRAREEVEGEVFRTYQRDD